MTPNLELLQTCMAALFTLTVAFYFVLAFKFDKYMSRQEKRSELLTQHAAYQTECLKALPRQIAYQAEQFRLDLERSGREAKAVDELTDTDAAALGHLAEKSDDDVFRRRREGQAR